MPIYKMNGKKDGLQKYRVRINYTDATGKNRQIDRVAYGRDAARELEKSLMDDLTSETLGKITLEELYNKYMMSKQHEVRESSYDKIQQMLTKYVLPTLGQYKLNKLSTIVLQEWKDYLSNLQLPNNKCLSVSYMQNIYTMFTALLNYGVKMNYIDKNYLVILGNFKNVGEVKKEMDYYTTEEFLQYITVSRTFAETYEKETNNIHEWNYYIFFMIAFYTGMRKGEILALKWSDIYDNIIHVTRSITQKLKGEDRETQPKNKSSIRNIKIPKPLIAALNEHKERCIKLSGYNENWRICGGNRCIRDSTLDKRNKKYAMAAGVKAIRIHDFRHSHASLLANNGINIQEIARRLGHTNVEITWNTYSHLYPQEEDRALKILNEIM